MINRTFSDPMPGQAAIDALKLLKPARTPLLKSVGLKLKYVALWFVPSEAEAARIAARRARWYW